MNITELLSNWDEVENMANELSSPRYSREVEGRLGAGLLIEEIFETMKGVVTGSQKVPPKYVHYSAHDTTLQSIFSTLGL